MSGEAIFKEVDALMSRWSPKGEKVLSNGVRLVCPTPQVAPDAWLHVLFPPLTLAKIEEAEKALGAPLPDDYRDFLLRANGLMLFSYRVSVWGSRESMARTGDETWQPHDLLDHNYETERPDGSPKDVMYFGSANGGDDWCFFESGGSCRVGKTNRHHFRPTTNWSDFGSWLLDEIRTLESLFNSGGQK